YAVLSIGSRVIAVHVGGGANPSFDLTGAYIAPSVLGTEDLSGATARVDWTQEIDFDFGSNGSITGDDWSLSVGGSPMTYHAGTTNQWFTAFSVSDDAVGGKVYASFDIDHTSTYQGVQTIWVQEPVFDPNSGFWFWSVQPHSYGYTVTPYLELVPVDPADTFL